MKNDPFLGHVTANAWVTVLLIFLKVLQVYYTTQLVRSKAKLPEQESS